MSELTQRTTYETDLAESLIDKFASQTNWQKFMGVIGAELQEVEDMFWFVRVNRWIDNATNYTLAQVATIVGLTPLGWTDNELRRRIKAQILLNKSSGTINEIKNIFATIFPDGTYALNEFFPAGFLLVFAGLSAGLTPAEITAIGAEAGEILQKAKLGGVKASIILGPDEPVFTFDESGAKAWDSGKWASAF